VDNLSILAATIVSAALAACFVWLSLRTRSAVLREQVSTLDRALNAARGELKTATASSGELSTQLAAAKATLQEERKSATEKMQLLHSASLELRQAFHALAAEALSSNNESFLQLARVRLDQYQAEAQGDLEARQKAVESLVSPIRESLSNFDAQIRQIEKDRNHAYGNLTAQVHSLISTQEQLRGETGNLVKALRAPAVRGRWGEIQLKRVVEIAGMLNYCDFEEQVSVNTIDGRLRPDMVVRLPGGKNIVVDAKTPLQAYLDAVEATNDEVRKAKLFEHTQQVRAHMTKLGAKSYFDQFQPAPEFVFMFLPGEAFFSAALEQDPGLIEFGVSQGVIPASPTTLIALLKAVAYGWTQEKVAENAQRISDLGKELYERLRVFATHLGQVGKGLDNAVVSYNKAVGSLESRVLVSARRFPELLGANNLDPIPEPSPIDTTSRTLALVWGDEEILPAPEPLQNPGSLRPNEGRAEDEARFQDESAS
jgi:DNA recombination protein RmuC